MDKVAVFFMGRKRPGFDMDWGKLVRAQVEEFLKKNKITAVYPELILDAQTVRSSVRQAQDLGANLGIVLQTTMSDGRLAPIIAKEWGYPLVFWATPEKATGSMISSCSLVGTHVFVSTLIQLGIKAIFMHADPQLDSARKELNDALALARCCRSLEEGYLGLIGYHAPGFINMHLDPTAMSKYFGVQVRHFSIHDFVEIMNGISGAAIEADLQASKKIKIANEAMEKDEFTYQSRYYLALKELMATELLNALAVREWPELTGTDKMWPYLAFSRLASEHIPLSCEGDVDGALGHLIAESLDIGPAYISDWLEYSRNNVTLWHGGFSPLELCKEAGRDGSPAYAKHFNSKKPMVLDSELLEDMDITVFRFWHLNGRYVLAAFEAKTVKTARKLMGIHAVLSTAFPVDEWIERMLYKGMPHHITLVRGKKLKLLRNFARLYDIEYIL